MSGNIAPQDRKTSREQRKALFQSSKRNADFRGIAPTRDVWSVSSKLMHKGSAFMRGPLKRRAKLLNCLSLSPCASASDTFISQSSRRSAREKLPISKFSPGLFSKRPRIPAYPRVSPRIPRVPSYFVSGEVKGALLSLNICAIVPSATRPSIMPLISLTSSSLPNANANA